MDLVLQYREKCFAYGKLTLPWILIIIFSVYLCVALILNGTKNITLLVMSGLTVFYFLVLLTKSKWSKLNMCVGERFHRLKSEYFIVRHSRW